MGSQFAPSRYTVLIVDSDPRIRAELSALLERAGYQTRAYVSAEALLNGIDTLPERSGVIAEIELPGMSGLELATRLREQKIDAPMMILTRLGDVATAVRALRTSVADYLTKPYIERDLINRLETMLTKQSIPNPP